MFNNAVTIINVATALTNQFQMYFLRNSVAYSGSLEKKRKTVTTFVDCFYPKDLLIKKHREPSFVSVLNDLFYVIVVATNVRSSTALRSWGGKISSIIKITHCVL